MMLVVNLDEKIYLNSPVAPLVVKEKIGLLFCSFFLNYYVANVQKGNTQQNFCDISRSSELSNLS